MKIFKWCFNQMFAMFSLCIPQKFFFTTDKKDSHALFSMSVNKFGRFGSLINFLICSPRSTVHMYLKQLLSLLGVFINWFIRSSFIWRRGRIMIFFFCSPSAWFKTFFSMTIRPVLAGQIFCIQCLSLVQLSYKRRKYDISCLFFLVKS